MKRTCRSTRDCGISPSIRRVDARMQQEILAQLSSATIVEFAGPVLGYQEAVMIPRPEVIVTFDGLVDDERFEM